MSLWLFFFVSTLVSCIFVFFVTSVGTSGKIKRVILSVVFPLVPYLWLLNIGIGEHWRVKAGWITEEWFWEDLRHMSLLCIFGIVAGIVLFWGAHAVVLKIRAKKR